MRHVPDDPTAAGWSAVYALIERWADLPPESWHTLIAADILATGDGPAPRPDALELWLVRDLVDTAWSLANKEGRLSAVPWTVSARAALERVAWRLLDPGLPHRGMRDQHHRDFPWSRDE